MTGTMTACALGALAVYHAVVRPAERRREGEAAGAAEAAPALAA
jgi:hypothetical protein